MLVIILGFMFFIIGLVFEFLVLGIKVLNKFKWIGVGVV